jgi:hypothetical protein
MEPTRNPPSKTRMIRALAKALQAVMADAGGEPRKRDPDSAAAWRAAEAALEMSKPQLDQTAPGKRAWPEWTHKRLREADYTADEISQMRPQEAFEKAMSYEGIRGYASTLYVEVLALDALDVEG